MKLVPYAMVTTVLIGIAGPFLIPGEGPLRQLWFIVFGV